MPDGRKFPPALVGSQYVLGDPSLGRRKHTTANQVYVWTEQEAIDPIFRGFSIRIETTTSPSLIRKNLFVDGARVS